MCGLLVGTAIGQQPTFATLLRECQDLERLTTWPDPAYRTVQFSSTDRRSVAPDRPGWFGNGDGFGQEPIPGFERVLREPGADGAGEYLVCDVVGPGAIVRTWSAAMAGRLRVEIDDQAPVYDGRGDEFLARRSAIWVPGFAELPAAMRDLLQQQDADYLPVPFGKRLRITWTGRIADTHFYHLQVRCYAAGTPVIPFARADATAATVRAALQPPVATTTPPGEPFEVLPGGTFAVAAVAPPGGGVLRALTLRLAMPIAVPTLRQTVLRIRMDEASVAQVEVPLGDFFGLLAHWTPYASLPITVTAEGELQCRWPMPFARTWRLELEHHGAAPLRGMLATAVAARPFDAHSLHFHARWRVDHELFARANEAPFDVDYLFATGRGRLVGLSCALVNPPMAPSWRSNWWGEGDEKIAVDAVFTTLGTGSEDYFNYSWAHWRRFGLPFCGQPLATGPGNCGFVVDYRHQVIDDLPFERSLGVAMELWSHRPVHPLSYARTTSLYAAPGLWTDHRPPQPRELQVPSLLPWTASDFATSGAERTWRPGLVPDACTATAGRVTPAQPNAWTRSGAVLCWSAPAGAELRLPFTIAEAARYRVRICCQQRPDAPTLQVLLDGERLRADGRDTFAMTCEAGERFEDLVFADLDLTAGRHVLTLHCPHGGEVGIDLVGYEKQPVPPVALPGAVEAELWDCVRFSPGVEVEVQALGPRWSSSHQRWIKAQRVGDAVTFRVAAPAPGKRRVLLRLTTSWDFGIVAVAWNGEPIVAGVDTFCGEPRALGIVEVDLGERELTAPAELTFTVAGSHANAVAPGTYFGIDCVLLR